MLPIMQHAEARLQQRGITACVMENLFDFGRLAIFRFLPVDMHLCSS